ncbi:MAG: hypothetical protein IJS71_07080 [Clostridia bacterium]|nr:hypothetical protein [Clostridia bacterium]
MKNRDRLNAVLNFEKPDDRLPMIEWAAWWDKTINNWREQGLPSELGWDTIGPYLGLDAEKQYWLPHKKPSCPQPEREGGPIAEDEDEYEALLPHLFPDNDWVFQELEMLKPKHESDDLPIWFSLDGGFWFPRTILGIENHLYSFYDQPELYHRILDDLAEFQLSQMERMYKILTPDFMTFGEDMSYNNGPMISEASFDEFLLPYYRKVVPFIKEHGTKVIIDSDGDITRMIPWLKRAGIEGVLPLERQAGVDIVKLREDYPDFLFIGAFDKMTMRIGEKEMRDEFERLLPVMKSGGFVPSVDHQTPPDVPLERYKVYLEMFREYAEKAVS